MGKPTSCICKTKGADQLRSNCQADQRLVIIHHFISDMIHDLCIIFACHPCVIIIINFSFGTVEETSTLVIIKMNFAILIKKPLCALKNSL